MNSFNVQLVIKHQIVRDGISKILEGEEDINVVGSKSRIDSLADLSPQPSTVVVLDSDIPEVKISELLVEKNNEFPDTEILVVSSTMEKERIQHLINSGADGYMLKSNNATELVKAIKTVASGMDYLDEKVKETLFSGLEPPLDHISHNNLTDREREILILICKELTNREIAERLNISVRTVDAHRRNLLQKTDAKNTAGMVKYAIKHHIFET